MKKNSIKFVLYLTCLFITSQILAQIEKPKVRDPWIDIIAVETFCDIITGENMVRIEAKWNSDQICYFDILDLSGTPICQNILPVNIISQTSTSNCFYEIPQSCIVNGGNYKIIGRCSNPNRSTSILTFTANFENCNAIGCCPGKNLVENGDFEDGNVKFINQYAYNPSISAGATLPGQYVIVNESDAATISPTWLAQDHGTCPTPSLANFLVVNGQNGQIPGGWVTVWEQTIPIIPNKEYRFCAYMKNLPQCGFDAKPVILVDVNYTMLYPPTTISTISGLCNWQIVTFYFTPSTTSAIIAIKLRDTQVGDGNDLAIDDISLAEIPPLPSQFSQFNIVPSNVTNSTYNVTATPTNSLPATGGCGYYWEVCEVDNLGNCITSTTVSNPSNWWTGATDFPGYVGTNSLTGILPGFFQIGKRYKIRYGVWCECNGWSQSISIFEYNRNARKKFKITEVPPTSEKSHRPH